MTRQVTSDNLIIFLFCSGRPNLSLALCILQKLLPEFRIHDILVWIWIRGFMPLTNGSGCYFRHLPSRCQQKTNFLTQFFCLLLFEGIFKLFYKDKKSKRVTKQQESRFFLLFLHDKGSGSGSLPLTSGSGSGRPKNTWIRNSGCYDTCSIIAQTPHL